MKELPEVIPMLQTSLMLMGDASQPVFHEKTSPPATVQPSLKEADGLSHTSLGRNLARKQRRN